MRLRIDQDHLYVASVGGNGGGQVVEQSRAVLGHDLDERGGAAGLRIEVDFGGNARLPAGRSGPGAVAQQFPDFRPARNHALGGGPQPVHLAGIQLQVAHGVGEGEGIENHAPAVGESLRPQDVQPETGKRARGGGEQAGAVGGRQGHPPGRIQAADVHRHAARAAAGFERHVFVDFGLRVGAQVAGWKPFQKLRPLGAAGGDASYAVALQFPRELVVDRHIELPQLGRAPRRHGRRVHGRNIGVRQQSERLQALHRFHPGRRFTNGPRVEQVAPLHGGRKLQVVANQKENRLARPRRGSHAVHGRLGQPQRAVHMPPGRAFTGIVEQGRQNQRAGLGHFGKQIGERGAGAPELLHGHHGVLIHRVAMVEIANHQALGGIQLRKDRAQQAGLVHGAQGQRRVGQSEDAVERGPDGPRDREPGPQAFGLRFDPPGGFERGPDSVARRELEQAQRQLGVALQHVRLAQEGALAPYADIGIAQARPPVAELSQQAAGLPFQVLQLTAGGAVDGARMAVILAHP